MKDFFISYTKSDETWAEWISYVLEEENFTVLIQCWDFRPGSNFVIAMQEAAVEANRTIMVLSPDYLDSQFASPEWAAAFLQDPQGLNQRLVPVQVRPCQPSGLLAPIVQIRIGGVDEAVARRLLIDGINKKRAKPLCRPCYPGIESKLQRKNFPGSAHPALYLFELVCCLQQSVSDYSLFQYSFSIISELKLAMLEESRYQSVLTDIDNILSNVDTYNRLPRSRGSGYKTDKWLNESGFKEAVENLKTKLQNITGDT